ncbi:hypothetical protein QBZ16_001792 [Prototheca wickerhamii]|uniref:Uncharacterized protein n=1 Tax=Prototheca wickerhamii TaxID=3111 RepID=A0AAD9IEP1_PROWI|nr:hypothetical protein QBZ16_001792 [Prototheca wickerhamii]
MATTLGTVATAIAGFSVDSDDAGAAHKRSISPQTVELISLTLLPISVLMIAYALFIFLSRSTNIRKKQMGYFNEKVGPLGLAIIVVVCLTAILISAVKDVLLSKK